MNKRTAFVEIVARKKSCMLCDLAIGILEEISPEFDGKVLNWVVVDVSARDGLQRHDELTRICGRRPAVPSIVINEKIEFDHIPDMEALSTAVRQVIEGKHGRPDATMSNDADDAGKVTKNHIRSQEK